MTPTAVTPAARKKRAATTSRSPDTSTPRSPHPSTPRPAHRTPRSRAVAPTAPRRVSGPARPAAPRRSTAPKPTTVKPTAPTRSTRRSTAPARTRRPVERGRQPAAPLSVRTLAFLRGLPDHAVLDRLLRGRLWIPLLGVLLVGIVAMQVEVLKLNASIGHGFVRAGHLQSENERLANSVSQLSDVQRIEAAASRMGMTMPAAYMPQFLPGGHPSLRSALRNIHAPDPSAFSAALSAEAAHRAAEVQSGSGA